MSNQASSVLMRSIHRKPRHSQSLSQSDENCCGSSSPDIAPLLSRPPLNSITDPSQSPSGTPLHHFGCPSKDNLPTSISKKLDSSPAAHLQTTPKPYTRAKSSISEPNSAQTTPVRTRPRVSNAAASGLTVTRLSSQSGHDRAREGAAARDTASPIAEQLSACVPHFGLEEDFSFWKDHNVQVLIRVRPLNNAEMISQGNGRCLRQESPRSLVWLGHPETRFTFDHIACESTSQEKLFRVAGLPMVDNCMSGYNSCMFAYGQTGSGKTYTMMGEIDDMDGTLSDDCGITPRIFDYLFSRITKEEENEKLGNLTYSCKCSFLEIYNEQITDILEPSSINLQLREDLKKGVYVENLTEYNVRTVNDVLNLLKEGAANRKIAATNMNSESSRSHSVFTCIIESRWEKDSVTHRRFGRLNLVDLAGSERQKSSGAEGDRLKEAANINKSLSTLGLVIMSLVDSVQGKHRHVPYRDSRLTFLLQDSLGGNSKTTIIANVSPSLCCANETLGTLKFAQRAKLIQNNAKINEDASGGAIPLQMQIRQLKDQLSLLMKHQNCSMGPKTLVPPPKCTSLDHFPQSYVLFEEITSSNEHESSKKKHAGATLHGALRQEKLAEAEIRRLKTEIDVLNVLRDEEAQHMNMMLNFRDEKIKRLELLLEELMPVEKFYLEENNTLREENFLLHAQIKKNPQVIQLELENTRLLEQIKVLQDFYSQGNRERLLTEISDPHSQESELSKELEECKDMNSNLIRNVDELREQLANGMNSDHDAFKSDNEGSNILALQSKLDKVSDNIMEAEILSRQYIEDCATPISHLHQQAELVRSEFEMEVTRMINQLHEEIYRLQSEFHVCLCSVAEQNISLQNSVSAKEDEVKALCVEWEKATSELTSFLRGGSRSLWDASYEIKRISSLFPNVNAWISEHVSGAAKMCVEKEETILQLQKSLDDARSTVMQLEKKLYSLKDATIALTEFQQLENSLNGEEIQLSRKATDSKEVGELPGNKLLSKKGCISDSQANAPTSLPVEEKHDSCGGSFPKFHEACATIKEVDCMLKGILKENDNTNMLVGMWKHAAEKLMIDEACLSEEIKGLKTRTLVGDKEKKQLLEELQFSFKEKVNIFSFVEHCFLAVETSIGELFESAPKMVIPVIEGMQMYFCSMRSSLEDLMCKALQNNISMFVVQCQIDEHCLNLGRLNKSSKSERCLFQEPWPVADNPELSQANEDGHPSVQSVKHESKTNQVLCVTREEIKECEAHSDGTEVSSAELKRELDRKEELLNGLHFDFSLLQEFASQRKDIKNELERLIGSMSNIQQELLTKQAQLDSALVQKKHLERCLSEAELGLSHSNSELHRVKQELNILSKQNTELKDLLKDANLRNSKAEQLIDEQIEAIKGLEREIIWLSSSSSEKQLVSSVKDVQFALLELTAERDQLIQKFNSLQDKHDATAALADESQAVATEARQESQASKMYAEQKQEEVKILEHSVEELETTINVMEKKLHEMEEEIENQRLTRDSLEREIQALRCRLQTVEDLTGSMMVENSQTSIHKVQLSKFQEVNEAHSRIRFLEVVNEKQAKQIGQLNDYIAELVLHAEAQATQYQQKYKTLEAMFHEVRTDLSNVPAAPNSEKLDGISARTRGLSSPFKCIAGMIQQMNQEKDHELSSARLRIEELELMAASRYKEVCTLNTRLATTESMTHDVIRDLLGVKLDISNYVDIIEQHQLQKLIDEAQNHRQELVAMEQEIFKMKSHINDLHEERDRCIAEINNNNTDQLATHIIMEQLQEQNHLLIAQNGILKMDKTNLQKKVAEVDELLKNQFNGVSSSRPLNQPRMKYLLGSFDNNIAQRMTHSQNLLSRVNDQQHARHHRPNDDRMDTFGNDINFHVN